MLCKKLPIFLFLGGGERRRCWCTFHESSLNVNERFSVQTATSRLESTAVGRIWYGVAAEEQFKKNKAKHHTLCFLVGVWSCALHPHDLGLPQQKESLALAVLLALLYCGLLSEGRSCSAALAQENLHCSGPQLEQWMSWVGLVLNAASSYVGLHCAQHWGFAAFLSCI